MEADKKLAKLLAAECHNKFGFDIKLMDIRKKCDYCNHFMIISGRNKMHLTALAQHIKEFVTEHDVYLFGIDGKPDSGWIIVDLGSLVIHLFNQEMRAFYNLEGLWEKPKFIDLDLPQIDAQQDSKPSETKKPAIKKPKSTSKKAKVQKS